MTFCNKCSDTGMMRVKSKGTKYLFVPCSCHAELLAMRGRVLDLVGTYPEEIIAREIKLRNILGEFKSKKYLVKKSAKTAARTRFRDDEEENF